MRRRNAVTLAILALCALFPWVAQALPGTTASLLSNYTTDNVPSLTIGWVDQFGNANGGTITLNGATSGATVLQPNATGGGTITLPTTTTTLAGTALTQTFSGQNTFTGRVLFGTGGGAAFDSYNLKFSTIPEANPLDQKNYTDIPTASVNAALGYQFLSAQATRTIYPGVPTVMASGTAAGATSENILCSPSGRLIATIPIAALVTSVPINAFSSTSTGKVTPGPALAIGCNLGDGIVVSTIGSALTTTTDIFVNMPFTQQ